MPDKSRLKHEYRFVSLPDRGEDIAAALSEFGEDGWEVEHLEWNPSHTKNAAILHRVSEDKH